MCKCKHQSPVADHRVKYDGTLREVYVCENCGEDIEEGL